MNEEPSVPSNGVDVVLRPATPADLAAVHAMNEEALPAVNSVAIEFFTAYLHSADSVFQVAVDSASGTCVGFLLALRPGLDYASPNYRWFAQNYKSFLYVDRVVVSPAAQGMGLGQRLYNGLVLVGQSTVPPVKRICCEVNVKPRNGLSLRFHERFGFTKCFEHSVEGGLKVVRLMTYDIPSSTPIG